MKILYKVPIILVLFGIILLVIAILLPMMFPSFLDSSLNRKLVIAPNSEMLEKFEDPPVPLTFEVWMFNITNPKGILQGEKPKLHEVGPYIYIQTRKRVNVAFNHTAGTVKFNLKKHYVFNPSMSKGSEKDLVTTVNPVYMTFASKDSDNEINYYKMLAVTWSIRFSSKPFITRPVKELLFEGYPDKILKQTYKLKKEAKYKSGKFGFFYPKNGTIGSSMEILTGEHGMEDYQQIVKYKGRENLNYWKEDRCNKIVGTDGTQFPRPVTKHQTINFFTVDLCRSVYGVYEKDVYLGPLKLHRFILPEELLAFSPENNCYCPHEFSCRQSMIDISPCKGGAPIVISTPHFYQGHQKDIDELEGLKPNKAKHETYLDVEPTTGVTMRANKRIQVNIAFKRYGIPALSKVPEVIMPILWVSESAEASLDVAESLYSKLTVPQSIVQYGCWAALAIAIGLLLLGLILCLRTYKKQKVAFPNEATSPASRKLVN